MKKGPWIVRRLFLLFALSITILMGTIFCIFLVFKVDVTVKGRGVVKCSEWLDIKTGIKGVIKNVHVKEGQWVTKGTLLFELEERELELDVEETQLRIEDLKSNVEQVQRQLETTKLNIEAAIDEATAGMTEANARYRIVQKGPKPEEISLAKGRIKRADEKLAKALLDSKRIKKAFALKLVSGQDLEESLHSVRLAQVDSSLVRDDLALLRNMYNTDDIAASEAGLARATAQREKALIRRREVLVLQNDLDRAQRALAGEEKRLDVCLQRLALAHVRAPIDGHVLTHDPVHLVGQGVQEGTVVIRLGDRRKYAVDCRVSERDIPLVAVGQTVRVQITPFPKGEYRLFDATVVGVGADAKNMISPEEIPGPMSALAPVASEGSYSVLLELQGPYSMDFFGETYSIKPGYSAEVEIITNTERLASLLLRRVIRIGGVMKTEKLHL